MRTHLLKYFAAPVALLSGLALVLIAGAAVAWADGTTVSHGAERVSGLTGGGPGGGAALALVLVLVAVAVAGVAFAVVSGRRRTVAQASGQITDLPGARRDDESESGRKAA